MQCRSVCVCVCVCVYVRACVRAHIRVKPIMEYSFDHPKIAANYSVYTPCLE